MINSHRFISLVRPSTAPNRVREKVDFLSRFKLIGVVSPNAKKISFRKPEIVGTFCAPRLGKRGVRVVTNARRDAMDAGGVARRAASSRTAKSCVVLAPRRWSQVGGSNSAGDGGKRARSPGSTFIGVKTIARGMPGDPGVTVVTNSCAFYFAREAMGAASARPSLRPLFLRGRCLARLGAHPCREKAGLCPPVL